MFNNVQGGYLFMKGSVYCRSLTYVCQLVGFLSEYAETSTIYALTIGWQKYTFRLLSWNIHGSSMFFRKQWKHFLTIWYMEKNTMNKCIFYILMSTSFFYLIRTFFRFDRGSEVLLVSDFMGIWRLCNTRQPVWHTKLYRVGAILYGNYQRKRKSSDSVLWQKPLHPQKKSKKQRDKKKTTKNFDYTTIADRLRTVSWSSNSHPWCG